MTNPLLSRVAAPPIGQAAVWAAAYDGAHGPLINLSQAVPGHAPPAELAERLSAAAGMAAAARYGPVLGDTALRAAYADHVSSLYGAGIASAEVAITAGCNQAFFAALMTLARTGDAVILPGPAYFNHTMTLQMLGIEARLVETTAASGFVPEVAAIERLIDDRVKAVALVSPNNPTGAIYPPALLAAVFALCQRRGVALILDETYRDFLPPGNGAPHGLFAVPGWQETLVGLYSFSKSYAIPGHRLGAMIASEAFLAQAEKVLDCVQICAPRPPQAAVEWAIPALAEWRAEMTAEILSRAEIFRETLAPHPDWRIEQMGAYFAYVRHPFPGRTDVAEILARRFGVVTLPGSFFGPGQEDHLRIAFANVSAERIAGLGERLARAEVFLAGAEDPAPIPALA
ncbi:hypothetical protein Sa4125_09920 [Aureimonas sp. SA4125]|uniref:aminotransferase n=1 Tax=Aureimonas sp. SA4125 TaxID=2826993 RepID=UPI001CC3BE77|nr:aminotransferase [Aureimonas sp. SA4125]BDA83450.1 hypothetical protein Sa4125_09920 [Aureimonas sp. SA4125]